MNNNIDEALSRLKAEELPWSKSKLKKLGKLLIAEGPAENHQAEYEDVMIWYNELAIMVQEVIEAYRASDRAVRDDFKVTSRSKTIDTLTDRLRRTPAIQLPSIADIAGVRIEGDFTLTQQDQLATDLMDIFGHDEGCIKDLRNDDHSGYRAVHLWLSFAGRVEVQIRTQLQGAWANAYETAADALGRGIRYGEEVTDEDHRDSILFLQRISRDEIATLEREVDESEDLTTLKIRHQEALAESRELIDEIPPGPQRDEFEAKYVGMAEAMRRVEEANYKLNDIYQEKAKILHDIASSLELMYRRMMEGAQND